MTIHIGQVLRQSALRFPANPAVVELSESGRRVVDYRSLDERARVVAAGVLAFGARPGDRIALMAHNSVDFVAAWFGITYAACTVVPIPVRSAVPEVVQRLTHASATAMIADELCRSIAQKAAREADLFDVLQLEQLASSGGAALDYPVPAAGDSPAMILYTSGTTGRPKGVTISHASLMCHTASLVHHTLGLSSTDIILGALPLSHSYGCRMTMLVTFYAAATVVLLPRFDATDSLKLIRDEAVTWVPAVPTMFAAWARAAQQHHLVTAPASLMWCLSAGAPLSEDIRLRAERVLGAEIRQGYGMTEATFSTIDSPGPAQQPGTVGRPVWGVEVRVVDDSGRDVDTHHRGQVLIRGQNLMLGYLRDPEATEQATANGWMHTGDVGCLDGQGVLTIVDRTRDLILRGGFSVYPSEIEEALCEHPEVAEVAVVGRPDAYYGEEIVAVIVAQPGAAPQPEQLVEWARERVAREKVPREYALVEALPIGASGKVVKRELVRQLVAGELRPNRAESRSATGQG